MITCLAVRVGNEYIDDTPRLILNSYYNGIKLNSTDNMDEAKHWPLADRKKVEKWLKTTTKRYEKKIEIEKKDLAEAKQKNNWKVQSLQKRVNGLVRVIAWLNKATIVEIEVEQANYDRRFKLVWMKGWDGNDLKHNGKMQYVHENPKTYCKVCNIKLKKIPHFLMVNGNNYRICVPCLKLRVNAINKAYEDMDDEIKEAIIQEQILGAI